jgi:hypothetical protein
LAARRRTSPCCKTKSCCVPRLRASQSAGILLDGVKVGSLALMAVVTLELARAALVDAKAVLSRSARRYCSCATS